MSEAGKDLCEWCDMPAWGYAWHQAHDTSRRSCGQTYHGEHFIEDIDNRSEDSMTNHPIDTDTGLPKLPEGHFWRIKGDRVEIHQRIGDTEWQDRPSYGYTYVSYSPDGGRAECRTVDIDREREVVTKRFLRRKLVTTETYVDSINKVRYVDRSFRVITELAPLDGGTKTVPGEWHPAEYSPSYGYGYSYQPMRLIHTSYRDPDREVPTREAITRDNVVDVCQKAMDRFDALHLLGDYPPKVLS